VAVTEADRVIEQRKMAAVIALWPSIINILNYPKNPKHHANHDEK
jgi:hypothetical protein